MPGRRLGVQAAHGSMVAARRGTYAGGFSAPQWGFSSHLEATKGGLIGTAQAAKLKTAGATILRNDISWDGTETSKGVFDWTTADLVMGACQANGLKLVVQAGYTPSWARGGLSDNKCRPTNTSDFADWIYALASRAQSNYPGVVAAIEYWNEPNISFLHESDGSQCHASVYAAMALAAYAKKKANDPAPTIELWAGATAHPGEYSSVPTGGTAGLYGWLTDFIAAGGMSSFDAWSLHPYQYVTDATTAFLTDTTTGASNQGYCRTFFADSSGSTLQTRLANAGYTGKIHGTEWGVPTYAFPSGTHITDCTSEANQAILFPAAWNAWRQQARAGHLFYYTGFDDSSTDTTSRENHFGAFRSDLGLKQIVTNMQAA